MRTASNSPDVENDPPLLISREAQAIIDHHGREAFWVARERQKGQWSSLGRAPDYWLRVASEIAERQGIFGRREDDR